MPVDIVAPLEDGVKDGGFFVIIILMTKTLRNNITKRIKVLRKASNLTQQQLADISEVDYKHIQKLESSNPGNPKIETLDKIAKAFKMSLSELLKF